MIKSIVPIDTMQGDNMYFKRLRDLREDHDMKQSEVAEFSRRSIHATKEDFSQFLLSI